MDTMDHHEAPVEVDPGKSSFNYKEDSVFAKAGHWRQMADKGDIRALLDELRQALHDAEREGSRADAAAGYRQADQVRRLGILLFEDDLTSLYDSCLLAGPEVWIDFAEQPIGSDIVAQRKGGRAGANSGVSLISLKFSFSARWPSSL